MSERKIIKIYTGINMCGNIHNPKIYEFHPVFYFEFARRILREFNDRTQENLIFYSNSPYFVSSLYYISEKHKIPCEIYLNDQLSTLEDAFDDWDRFYDLLGKELK